MEQTGKKPSETKVVTAVVMMPQDANPAGNVHGGVTMKYIDTTGGVVAKRHSGTNVVTASIDRLDFLHPVYIGDLLILKASLNYVGKTSMEIGVRVETENLMTGKIAHCASAYITYVALDANGRPRSVPPVIPETDEEKRRYMEALERRNLRLAERLREKKSQG